MNDADLPIVLAEFKRKHAHLLPHIKELTAQQGMPVAGAATVLLQALLQIFDESEQAKWQLRDLLQQRQMVQSDQTTGFYYCLRYNATEMVYRIAVAGELDPRGITYFSDKQPPEISNWKADR